MSRKRTSIVWSIGVEEFSKIIATSSTLTAVAKAIGACPQAGTFRIIKARLSEENIDFSHISLGRDHAAGKRILFVKNPTPLDSMLVEHSPYSRNAIKYRLLKLGVFKNECSICGLGPVWNGKKITMRLDHLDGISNNYRLENLRMVCPNCDSQLPTFCKGNAKKKLHLCIDCGEPRYRRSKRCRVCRCKANSVIGKVKTKIQWPSDMKLAEMIRKTNRNQVADTLGISWNGLNHRLAIHKIAV